MKTRPLRSGLKWFKVKFVNVTFPPVFFFLWTENKKTKRWALHSSVSLLFFALCYWPLRAQTELLPFVFPAPSPSTLLLHLHLPSAMWVIRGLVIVSGLVFLADILHLYPDSLIKRKFIVCLSAVYSSSTTNKLTPSWSEGGNTLSLWLQAIQRLKCATYCATHWKVSWDGRTDRHIFEYQAKSCYLLADRRCFS